jgi:hypothetical protein
MALFFTPKSHAALLVACNAMIHNVSRHACDIFDSHHPLHNSPHLASVTPGKLADVIAVPGNSLDHISLMKRVTFVMKEGVV